MARSDNGTALNGENRLLTLVCGNSERNILPQLPQHPVEKQRKPLVSHNSSRKVGTTYWRSLSGCGDAGEAPSPGDEGESFGHGQAGPHSVNGRCVLPSWAGPRPYLGSARILPATSARSGQGRRAVTNLPAPFAARRPGSKPGYGPAPVRPSDATPDGDAAHPSGSGMPPRPPSIACTPSRGPRPSSPPRCSAAGNTLHGFSPIPPTRYFVTM